MAGWTLAGSAPAVAQEPARPEPADLEPRIFLDSTEAPRRPAPGLAGPAPAPAEQTYLLATTLLANGRTDEATALLEDLYDQRPALAVWLKLKEAYVAGRQFEALVGLVDDRVAREGPTPDLLAERGAALHRAGRAAEAQAAWAQAVAAAPDAETTYRMVADQMAGLRLFAEAAAVLDGGRQRLGDERLFLLDRARLAGFALDYAAAVDLYLQLLAVSPEYLPAVQSQLARLLPGQDAPEIFADAIERASALDPLSRSLRELQSWLALERGDYDAALDAVRALDRLEREEGESLLAFAVQAQSAPGDGPAGGAPQAAARALDEVLERHPDGPAARPARLMRAQLYDQAARDARERADLGPTPNADAARDGYAATLDAAPGGDAAPAAALALADLLRDVYRDFDGAEARLTQAAAGRDPGVAAQARLALGDVALRRGDLDAARERFSDVDETVRVGPLAEQARYELALVDFYQGFMFSALARAEALDENTAADAANDAIALRVTLAEVLDPEAPPEDDPAAAPVHVYARAALLHRQGRTGETLAALDSLDRATNAAHPLADESLYLRASALLAAGQAERAVAVLDRLETDHAGSFFLDRALRLQAQAYERDLGDADAAAARYDRLLERFPGSPLAPEARAELRRLRTPS